MDLPKPSHNVILAGVMAVAVLAIMLASYVAYPDMGSTDNEKSSDYENTAISVSIENNLVVTYNGTTLHDGTKFTVPFNENLTINVKLPQKGTYYWSYTSTGMSGSCGSGDEFGHAGDVKTFIVSNTWCDTIDIHIRFAAGD